MELTFSTELGEYYVVEIDENMELENVMALLEAESGIPVAEQSISYEGRDLSNPKSTMKEFGVGNKAILLLRRKLNVAGTSESMQQDAEMMRLQILGDPNLMRQLEHSQPELANAARSDPARFSQLLRQFRQMQADAELERQREMDRLEADPFDVEAQRKIEEAIRQQAVLENMDHALEYSPEAFGRVTMLYIPIEVNGVPLKAFVDSGAQQTIMSPECAEACNIMRLVDRRFSGVARGVGTAQILGRVHSAQMKVQDLFLACSFTIMEGRDVDLLFGLDMLKAHQACIDLEKGVLRIQGREVKFLAEHELPEKARVFEQGNDQESGPQPSGSGSSNPNTSTGQTQGSSFPGHGNTLGAPPKTQAERSQSQAQQPQTQQSPASRYPESSIKLLMDLGVTREVAIQSLDASGGNVDVAASLLF